MEAFQGAILISVRFDDGTSLEEVKEAGAEICRMIENDIPFAKEAVFTTEVAEAMDILKEKR